MRKGLALIALLICVTMVQPLAVGAVDEKPAGKFKDVAANYWARAMIEQAVEKGYVDGFTDGTFKPENKVTRAEFIKMLVDALKLPHVEKGSPWYQPYVASLIEMGIHKESDFKSNYDSSLSRLEMVKLAARATNPGIDNDPNGTDPNYLVFLGTQSGILQGTGNGNLDLKGTSTRAQAVVIIERILSVNAGKKLTIDKYAMSSAELAWHRTNVFTVMPEFFRTQYPFEVEQSIDPINKWDVSKMTLTSKDGKYSGAMNRIIAIDLADPKDPNRNLLGDINKLKWYANGPVSNGVAEGYSIKSVTNSYILFFDGELIYNKDKKSYADERPVFTIIGDRPNQSELKEFYKGKLNIAATVFVQGISDTPAFIIPKTSSVKYEDLIIRLYTPSFIGASETKVDLIEVAGPGNPYVMP